MRRICPDNEAHARLPVARKAKAKRIFGTKMRSVIKKASGDGIQAIVDQQFEVAAQILAAGLVPIVEPEVDIHCPDKARAEGLLKAALLESLNKLPADQVVMLKITLPEQADFYAELVNIRRFDVVALSGGGSGKRAMIVSAGIMGWWPASRERSSRAYLPSNPIRSLTPCWIPPFKVSTSHPSPEALQRCHGRHGTAAHPDSTDSKLRRTRKEHNYATRHDRTWAHGRNMVRRLIRKGYECVVYDRSTEAVNDLVKDKAAGSTSLVDLTKKLQKPRAVWLMVPAAVVDKSIADLLPLLEPGDILIDGGNSYYVDDIRRAKELAPRKIHYVDVGTSGGVWGLERGYCMMIGGEKDVVQRLDPIFAALAPGSGDIPRTPDRPKNKGTAENGYLHCGPNGAGHFVKMVHNGIEYGIMAAYAEGLGVLRDANVGKKQAEVDAETTPLRVPEHYQYDLDLGEIAEVWRRGSVIASWLLDLTATALVKDANLSQFAGRVSDSGEGRWTIKAAIDEGVPVPVLTTALYERFASRGEADYQDKLLSAMRFGFGGHLLKKA
jgi:6-phosphogluconate dehydrogenase